MVISPQTKQTIVNYVASRVSARTSRPNPQWKFGERLFVDVPATVSAGTSVETVVELVLEALGKYNSPPPPTRCACQKANAVANLGVCEECYQAIVVGDFPEED